MHLVFNLIIKISIILINLQLLNRSVIALSFTSNFNPFFSKSSSLRRNQLTPIDNDSFITSHNNLNLNTNLQNLNNLKPRSIIENKEETRSKWPNIRFMRTFLRNSPAGTGNQLINNQFNNSPKHLILGFNSNQDELTNRQSAKLPPKMMNRNANENENIGLIDWNKILTKLNKATGFKNPDLNETTLRENAKHPEFYSITSNSSLPFNDKKEEEERESNGQNGLINYFTTFFSSSLNLNENETINSDKEKQLTKIKQKLNDNDGPISSALDLFYFNDNLLAKKQIEVLVCDKTMAIINVRKNRFRVNRTIHNCVLFDLEKRSKEAEETVKKLKINKVDVDFWTMMDVINQCKRFSEPIDRIDTIEFDKEPVNPIKIKAVASTNNSFKLNNLTFSSNINIETGNKSSSINLITGIVSGTLWCGLGDIAKNYTDLGPRKDLDICCRAHDHCPIRLRALRYGYGLLNFGISTKSHCECDKDFFKCLKNVNTKLSNTIGHVYFNVLKLQCIEEGPTCVEFEVEKSNKKDVKRKKNMMQFKSSDTY